MPKYIVTIQRALTYTCEITVSAKDEDALDSKIDSLISSQGWASKQDWELQDEEFDTLEVNEE